MRKGSEVGGSYYEERLAADQLARCYEVAPPPVRRFLEVESSHVAGSIEPGSSVLELGCGYGRVLKDLEAAAPSLLVGVDISYASLQMADRYLATIESIRLARMNACNLAFASGKFQTVCCIQNGISAFHVDQKELIFEAVRVAAPGGKVLFSSYADLFWDDRLNWFRIQADEGLIGEIDEEATGNGIIRCRDGFTATTVRPAEFEKLTGELGDRVSDVTIRTIAGSSVFCEIDVM